MHKCMHTHTHSTHTYLQIFPTFTNPIFARSPHRRGIRNVDRRRSILAVHELNFMKYTQNQTKPQVETRTRGEKMHTKSHVKNNLSVCDATYNYQRKLYAHTGFMHSLIKQKHTNAGTHTTRLTKEHYYVRAKWPVFLGTRFRTI